MSPLLFSNINTTLNYDFSIWDMFLNSITSSIRNITDMAIWVFAFITVWVIATALLKHFSNSAFVNNGFNKKSISREIFSSDIHKNLDLIDDDFQGKSIFFLSNNKKSNKSALVFDKQHSEAYGEMSDLRKEQAKHYYNSKSKGQIK